MSGRLVARYYDPRFGRFLQQDPLPDVVEQARVRAVAAFTYEKLSRAPDSWGSGEFLAREQKVIALTMAGSVENRLRAFDWIREELRPAEANGQSPGNQAKPQRRKETVNEGPSAFTGAAKGPTANAALPSPGLFRGMGPSAELTDLAAWNRYAYAAGNPLTNVDPDGKEYVVKDRDGKEVARLSREAFDSWKSEHAGGDQGLKFIDYEKDGQRIRQIHAAGEHDKLSDDTLVFTYEWQDNKAASAEVLLAACAVGAARDYAKGLVEFRNLGKDLGAAWDTGDKGQMAWASVSEGLRVLQIAGYAMLAKQAGSALIEAAKPGVTKPPNPWGQHGNPSHRATVRELSQEAAAEFPDDIIHEGTSIRSKTGVNRRPDVWVEDRTTGEVKKIYEAARANKSGDFVSREVRKMEDYVKAGIEHRFKKVE